MIEQYALGAWCLYCVYSQAIIALILLLATGWHVAEYVRLRRAVNRVRASFKAFKED